MCAKACELVSLTGVRSQPRFLLRTLIVSLKFHAVFEQLPLGAEVSKADLNLFPLIGDSPGRNVSMKHNSPD